MLTSPARHAHPAGPASGTSLLTANAHGRGGLVVRLELPPAPTGRSLLASDDEASWRPGASADPEPSRPDLSRLARAIQDLVRVAAPGVIAHVSVTAALPTGPVSVPPPVTGPVPAGPGPGSAGPVSADPGSGSAGGAAGLQLDLVGRSLTMDGRPVFLTRREFDLLAYLQQRSGVALSRRELMSAVWQTGYLAGDRTIDVHVRRLRVKLGRHAHRLTTLRGYGYRYD